MGSSVGAVLSCLVSVDAMPGIQSLSRGVAPPLNGGRLYSCLLVWRPGLVNGGVGAAHSPDEPSNEHASLVGKYGMSVSPGVHRGQICLGSEYVTQQTALSAYTGTNAVQCILQRVVHKIAFPEADSLCPQSAGTPEPSMGM